MDQLERQSFIPLYFQLAQQLRGKISAGEWSAGSEIPSERCLMETYQVSRNTVRQALDLLNRDGLIIREQGSGTRVANLPFSFQYLLNSFFENRGLILRAGYQPTVNVLSSQTEIPPEAVRLALGLAPDTAVIVKKLVFYANDRPVMYTLDYLPQYLGENYNLSPQGAGFLSFLDHASGKKVEYVMVEITPVEASGEAAATFNCPAGSPLLLMKEIFLDENQKQALAFSMNYFNRELIDFRLLMKRG